jgi:hypothetical protein
LEQRTFPAALLAVFAELSDGLSAGAAAAPANAPPPVLGLVGSCPPNRGLNLLKNAIYLHIRDRDVLDLAHLDASALVLTARNNLCWSLIKLLAPGKDPDPNMSQPNVQMAVSRRMAAKLRAIRATFAKVRRKMSRADYLRYIRDATTGLGRTLAALNHTSCYGDLVPRFQLVKSTELYMSVAELGAPLKDTIPTFKNATEESGNLPLFDPVDPSIQFHRDGSELTAEDAPPRAPYVDFLIY